VIVCVFLCAMSMSSVGIIAIEGIIVGQGYENKYILSTDKGL
jgi:hypothetical protein